MTINCTNVRTLTYLSFAHTGTIIDVVGWERDNVSRSHDAICCFAVVSVFIYFSVCENNHIRSPERIELSREQRTRMAWVSVRNNTNITVSLYFLLEISFKLTHSPRAARCWFVVRCENEISVLKSTSTTVTSNVSAFVLLLLMVWLIEWMRWVLLIKSVNDQFAFFSKWTVIDGVEFCSEVQRASGSIACVAMNLIHVVRCLFQGNR